MSNEKELGSHEHKWPENGGHLYGPWFPKNRTQKYRQCVHPECSATETVTPKA